MSDAPAFVAGQVKNVPLRRPAKHGLQRAADTTSCCLGESQ